jgi:hypothetical protein
MLPPRRAAGARAARAGSSEVEHDRRRTISLVSSVGSLGGRDVRAAAHRESQHQVAKVHPIRQHSIRPCGAVGTRRFSAAQLPQRHTEAQLYGSL